MGEKYEDKIQTGLRVPASRYKQLLDLSNEMGVSINALILMLIDLGLSLRANGVILPQQSK